RMSHLPIFIVFRFTFQHPILDDAVLEHSEIDFLVLYRITLELRPPQPFLYVIVKVLMESLDVNRIERIFHDLKPVTGDRRRADIAQDSVTHKQIQARQERRRRRAQVREDQPAELLNGIGRDTDALFKSAVGILGLLIRLLEKSSVPIIQPTVISASEAVVLRYAQRHGHSSVRALRTDQTRPAFFVSIQYQRLT